MMVLPRGTYVGGLGTTLASHVTFTGQATIMPGWYAGYVLQLEMDEHDHDRRRSILAIHSALSFSDGALP